MADNVRNVFGIDLGTTYSCVAQVDPAFDQPIVHKNLNGQNTTPSVVYFEKDDKVVVGDDAKEMLVVEPDRTVDFIKREISKDEAYDNPNRFPASADPTIISSHILRKIVQDANDTRQDPEPITRVVITCPAYFGTKERMRTKQAGEIAGLEVLGVINEPTAAAIAYGMKLDEDKNILVYDLGGGTFDVTVIRVTNRAITVIATGGDHHLGGYDWDRKLAEHLLAEFNKENGTSYTMDSNKALKNSLMRTAEVRKKSLTAKDSAPIVVDFEGKSLKTTITREQFENMTAVLLEETIDKTQEVLDIAKEKGVSKIDDWLLVGGSSKMPQIKARVDREFGCNAKLTDPDECVAKGAAIYALNESFSQAMDAYADGDLAEKPQALGQKSGVRVVNVTSKSYGTDMIIDGEKKVDLLIPANTPLQNCKAVGNYVTSVENQSAVPLDVFESDVMFTRDENGNKTGAVISPSAATLLKEYAWKLNQSYPKGESVKVTFAIDSEGILEVYGEIRGEKTSFQLELKGVKNDAQMAAAKRAAAQTTVE